MWQVVNHVRYYRLVGTDDSLILLGGSVACPMKRFTMKKTLRQANALQRGTMLRLCVSAAMAAGLTGTLMAADAVHARPRHATTQSAGVQAAHGRIQVTAFTRRQERDVVATRSHGRVMPKTLKRDVSEERSAKKSRPGKHEVERSVSRKSVARGRERERETKENVRRGHGRALRQVPQPRASVTSQRETASVKTDAVHETKAATVEDFLRAAKQGSPQVKNEIASEGTAKPDESDKIETVSAAAVVKPAAKGVKKATPVVTADVAPTSAPRQRVVEGFGAEAALAPSTPANSLRSKKATLPVDDWKNADNDAKRAMTDEAAMPVLVPLYSRSGKLITPAPLKGSHEILVHQNTMADQEGLSRIQDDADLDRMLDAHLLVKIPETTALYVNEELPMNRRYARPWTVKFVEDMSRSYAAKFHDALRLSSAVRTVDFQLRLQRVNGNAAAVDGDTASPHLTGQAVDFGKKGMSREEISWMRAYLMPYIQAGKIDVEEEFQQSCFHISVYSSYLPKKKVSRMDVAEGQ